MKVVSPPGLCSLRLSMVPLCPSMIDFTIASSRGGLIYAGQIRTRLGEYEVIPFTDMKELF